MHTLLSVTRPADEQDRLDNLTELTHDIRVSRVDRVSLRVGLWLLLRAERRARAQADRAHLAARAIARDERARAEREAAWERAAITMQYR